MPFERRHFTVRHAASRDDSRLHLNVIRWKPDGSFVATDGHILAKLSGPEPGLDEPVHLDRIGVEALAKAMGKCAAVPDRKGAQENGAVRFEANQTTVHVEKRDVEFPDYSLVMPKGEPRAVATLSVPVLERVVKMAKEHGAPIRFEIRDETGPVRCISINREKERLEMIAMSMRDVTDYGV